MIINYEALYKHNTDQRFNIIKELILENHNITVILDESHKSKGENISEIIAQISPYINKTYSNRHTDASSTIRFTTTI